MLTSLLEYAGLVAPKAVNQTLKTQAYKEGIAGRFENPYPRNSIEWKSWRDGLRQADSEAAMSI